MKLAPEVVSLISAAATWITIELVKAGIRELRRESAERVEEERTIRGIARVVAEEEKRSGETEILYSHRIGAGSSPE